MGLVSFWYGPENFQQLLYEIDRKKRLLEERNSKDKNGGVWQNLRAIIL